MGRSHAAKRNQLVVKTIAFGALSAAMYTVLFMNSAVVMTYFTKGMAYAALPILTVFAFSFVHAAFAGNVWSLLGIEATQKRPEIRPAAQPRSAQRQRPRPRAYINT